MKLRLLNPTPLQPSAAPVTAQELTELRQLYERMVSSSFGDSESLRQSILARMILLQCELLTKYSSTNPSHQ
jgi:hypothetical protein